MRRHERADDGEQASCQEVGAGVGEHPKRPRVATATQLQDRALPQQQELPLPVAIKLEAIRTQFYSASASRSTPEQGPKRAAVVHAAQSSSSFQPAAAGGHASACVSDRVEPMVMGSKAEESHPSRVSAGQCSGNQRPLLSTTTTYPLACTWHTVLRQKEAYDLIDTCPEPLRRTLKVFAEEVAEDGRRRFIVTTSERMWEEYEQLLPAERHHYEIIREGCPCHLYFDLEFLRQYNPGRNGDAMVQALVEVVAELIKERFGFVMKMDWVLELDSSTDEKFSRHLLVKIKRAAFKDNMHVKAFVAAVVQRIRDLGHEQARFADFTVFKGPRKCAEVREGGDPAQQQVAGLQPTEDFFIDTSVYSRNRAFRLFLSSKFGKKAILLATDRFGFSSITSLPGAHTSSAALAGTCCHLGRVETVAAEHAAAGSRNINTRSEVQAQRDSSESSMDAPCQTGHAQAGSHGGAGEAAEAALSGAAAGVGCSACGVAGQPGSETLLSCAATAADATAATLNTPSAPQGPAAEGLACSRLPVQGVESDEGRQPGCLRPAPCSPKDTEEPAEAPSALFTGLQSSLAATASSDNSELPGATVMRVDGKARKSIFFASLVCFMDPQWGGTASKGSIKILKLAEAEGLTAAPEAAGRSNTNQSLCMAMNHGGMHVPMLETFIQSVCCQGGVVGRIRSWSILAGTSSLLVNIKDNRWCGNIQAQHRSNGIYYLIDIQEGTWHQRCYDPCCRSFRSAAMPLPNDVWDHLKRHVLPVGQDQQHGTHLVSKGFQDALLSPGSRPAWPVGSKAVNNSPGVTAVASTCGAESCSEEEELLCKALDIFDAEHGITV